MDSGHRGLGGRSSFLLHFYISSPVISVCLPMFPSWREASPLTHSLLRDVLPQSEHAAVKPVCLRCNFWSHEPKENFSPLPYISWVFSHGERILTEAVVNGLMNWLEGILWAILVILVMEHPRGTAFCAKMSGVVLCERSAGVVLNWEYVLLDFLLLLLVFFFWVTEGQCNFDW